MIDYYDVQRADALASHAGSYGCAEHQDPDCLCDVVIDKPCAISDVPPLLWNFEGTQDFIRLTELLLGKLELIDLERCSRFLHREFTPDPDVIEMLWHTHWDRTITAQEAGDALGFSRAHTLRIAAALGLEWVTRIRNTNSRHHHPGRNRYIQLREQGLTRAQAVTVVNEEFPGHSHHLTLGMVDKWWWKHNRQVAA
jgi:hypothetical protein